MTILCGTSFHLEHPIGGGQGLVVSGEGEVAEAGLQVDDQVGGAVEREGGVTRKKREPAMQWTGPSRLMRLVSFVQRFDRQVRHQTCLASWSCFCVVSPFKRAWHTVCSSSTTNLESSLVRREQATGHLL